MVEASRTVPYRFRIAVPSRFFCSPSDRTMVFSDSAAMMSVACCSVSMQPTRLTSTSVGSFRCSVDTASCSFRA